MVVDFNGELYVNVTMKLKGHSLDRECPFPNFTRVSEASRKRKSKELQKMLEAVEFPDA